MNKTTQSNITTYLKGYKSMIKASVSPKKTNEQNISLKLSKSSDGKEQLMLDFGQKDLGLKHCYNCGMIYNSSEPQDVLMHNAFHKKASITLNYNKSKNDKVVEQFFTLGEIIVLQKSDKTSLKKVEKVLAVIESEFGFSVNLESLKNPFKLYLHLLNKQIIGLCLTELINQVIDVHKYETPDSHVNQYIRCGINKIWVHESHRRKRVATRLLDTVFINFLFGYALYKEDIAFLEPTQEGLKFAISYVGSDKLLLY